jgi:hypothetical protein
MIILILSFGLSLVSATCESNNSAPQLTLEFEELVLRNDLTYHLNLSEHYSDVDTADNLSFEVVDNGNLSIDLNYDDLTITAPDFVGTTEVKVRVNDSCVSKSNEFTVYVTDANPTEEETTKEENETEDEVINLTESEEEENTAPEIASEQESSFTITFGEDVSLSFSATDLEEDNLTYSWYVDGELSFEEGVNHDFSDLAVGEHIILVKVSDGTSTTEKSWNVIVEEPIKVALWLVISGVVFVFVLIFVAFKMFSGGVDSEKSSEESDEE